MPKTFMDDVAPAMPTAIEGPLQVVDPADHDSWIKIDPATAQLEAAGTARPTKRVIVSFARVQGSTSSAVIGLVIPAQTVAPAANGGFLASPFPIPDDMDVGEPAYVRTFVAPSLDSTDTDAAVRFVLAFTNGKPGESPNDGSVTLDWNAPDLWSAADPRLVLIDDGNGQTFPGDTFEHGDHLGLRIMRIGSADEDTLNRSVRIAEHLIFEYTARRY
jgi:hypothetical protein